MQDNIFLGKIVQANNMFISFDSLGWNPQFLEAYNSGFSATHN